MTTAWPTAIDLLSRRQAALTVLLFVPDAEIGSRKTTVGYGHRRSVYANSQSSEPVAVTSR